MKETFQLNETHHTSRNAEIMLFLGVNATAFGWVVVFAISPQFDMLLLFLLIFLALESLKKFFLGFQEIEEMMMKPLSIKQGVNILGFLFVLVLFTLAFWTAVLAASPALEQLMLCFIAYLAFESIRFLFEFATNTDPIAWRSPQHPTGEEKTELPLQ